MAVKSSGNIYTSDKGKSNSVICPVCSKKTQVRLFESTDISFVAILQKEDKNLHVAVCPNCSSVFSVNPRYFEEREKGTFVTMTEDDLTLLVKNNG